MATDPDSVIYDQAIAEIVGPSSAAPWEATLRPSYPWPGMFGFDTLSARFEFYDGTDWLHPVWAEGGTITGDLVIDGTVTIPGIADSPSYDDDAAAAAGGVALKEIYRNGNFLMVRLT